MIETTKNTTAATADVTLFLVFFGGFLGRNFKLVFCVFLFGWCWVRWYWFVSWRGAATKSMCVAKCNKLMGAFPMLFVMSRNTKNPSPLVDDRCITVHFSLSRIVSGVVHSVQCTPSKKTLSKYGRTGKRTSNNYVFRCFFVATSGECGVTRHAASPNVVSTSRAPANSANTNKSIIEWIRWKKSDFTNLYPQKSGKKSCRINMHIVYMSYTVFTAEMPNPSGSSRTISFSVWSNQLHIQPSTLKNLKAWNQVTFRSPSNCHVGLSRCLKT